MDNAVRDLNVMILAAGVGRRLFPLTEMMPKALLSVGGSTLLDRQLNALIAAGVERERVTVIGGHAYDRLVEALPAGVEAVFNDKYEEWNNIFSITLGQLRTGPTMVVNCDGLYHPEIFARAVNHHAEDFLVLDTVKRLGAEEMKVQYENGALVKIAKSLSPQDALGEYIGIARFSHETFLRVRQAASEMIESGETDRWYESAIERVAQKHRIGLVDIGGLPWTEVDDKHDFARAVTLAATNGVFGG